MPARITRDDVAHLAGLARIQLDEPELDRLAAELAGRDLPFAVTVAREGRDVLAGRDGSTGS